MTFFLRFQWLCKMCNRDPDDCTALFVEKLIFPEIKKCVRTANFTDAERYNCEHIAGYSERLETSLKLRNVGGNKTISVGAVSSSRGGKGGNRGRGRGANTQHAQSHTQSSTQSDGRASPTSLKGVVGGGGSETASVSSLGDGRRCYTCEGIGHISTSCPMKAASVSSAGDGRRCYTCEGYGHISSDCPTKKLNVRGIKVFRGQDGRIVRGGERRGGGSSRGGGSFGEGDRGGYGRSGGFVLSKEDWSSRLRGCNIGNQKVCFGCYSDQHMYENGTHCGIDTCLWCNKPFSDPDGHPSVLCYRSPATDLDEALRLQGKQRRDGRLIQIPK